MLNRAASNAFQNPFNPKGLAMTHEQATEINKIYHGRKDLHFYGVNCMVSFQILLLLIQFAHIVVVPT